MADTIAEKCWAELEDTLEGISRSAGFNTDVRRVVRGQLKQLQLNHWPCIAIIPGVALVQQRYLNNLVLWRQPLQLLLCMQTNTLDVHKKIEVLAGDAQKAVAANRTLGGIARAIWEADAHKDHEFVVVDEDTVALGLDYEIDYRTSGTDPTSST